MSRYYFLQPSLPPLRIGFKPELSFKEFMTRLEINLGSHDLKKANAIRQVIDIYNIRALLSGQKLDPRGSLTEKELEEALLTKTGLPEIVFDFLGQFETDSAKLKNFSGVLSRFFDEEIKHAKGFLRKYFIFEREFRLIMTALRAKQFHRDISKELQFEDLGDLLVAQILAQKDADRYDPPSEYQELKDLFIACGPDPWQQHKTFTEWKFAGIEEMGEGHEFSIDPILSYMVRLLLVEDWQSLDEEQGKEALMRSYNA